jgi:hypothetical protein
VLPGAPRIPRSWAFGFSWGAPRPEQVEDRAEGQPALHHRVVACLGAERRHVRAQVRDAVAHHQVGLEGQLRQARAERRDGAEGAGEDLAVAAEEIRDGDGAHLRAGGVAHPVGSSRQARTASW